MSRSPVQTCRVHGRPLTYSLLGIPHCRDCQEEARMVSPATAQRFAEQLARLPVQRREEPSA